MFSLKAEDIYDVAYPLHFSSNLFGLTSFTIVRYGNDYKATVNLFNLLCINLSTVWSIVAGLTFYANMDLISNSFSRNVSEFFEQSAFFLIYNSLSVSIVCNWWIFKSREKFPQILRLLNNVDEELKLMNETFNLKKQKLVILCFAFFVEALLFANIALSFAVERPATIVFAPVFNFCSTFVAVANIFACFHFTFWIWAIKLRMGKLNSAFKREGTLNQSHELLAKVAVLHEKLVDASELINHCYGVPVR